MQVIYDIDKKTAIPVDKIMQFTIENIDHDMDWNERAIDEWLSEGNDFWVVKAWYMSNNEVFWQYVYSSPTKERCMLFISEI